MASHRPKHLQDPFTAKHALLAVLIVLMGFALRLQSAGGDLWQDEIWSLNLAATMSAWHEAFWAVIHDNNHPLNTLYLYLAGPDREPWQYRLLSVVGGTLSIIAAGWAVARGGPGRVLTAMLLAAVLYPLVHFGSEARGYGLMVLFSFIAFGAVDRAEHETSPYRWLFALAVGLGTLSHFAILPIVFFMTVAFGLGRMQAGNGFFLSLHQTLRFGAPSAGVLGLIFGLVIYGMKQKASVDWFGGRAWFCPDQGCFIGAWDNIVSYSAGGFGTDMARLHSGLLLIFIVGGLLWLFIRANPRVWLYLSLWGGVSALYLALNQPDVPFARYVLPQFAFICLFGADVGAELRRASTLASAVFGLILLTFIGANAWSVIQFQDTRRGLYSQANALILNAEPSSTVRIASDHPYRVQMVLDYLNRHDQDHTFEYIRFDHISTDAPNWLVRVTRTDASPRQSYCLDSSDGPPKHLYQLLGAFEPWGIAGAKWDVYRRVLAGEPSCR
ncbi:hypothetical protein V5T82_14820 [Magnetovibrio sp. PR-2]|uniref:hypothetical protein n=1 Tax=Magnetovibrio sp. PR-2 TaxID=3120356 RepID=UPI002FCDFD63